MLRTHHPQRSLFHVMPKSKIGEGLAEISELPDKIPEQLSADGGFASKDNLDWGKGKGVAEVCFAKRRGLPVAEMVSNSRIYKKLRKFRAGIEANISALKRAYGLGHCNWTGWAGFQRYIWSAVCSYNLFVLARARLACP